MSYKQTDKKELLKKIIKRLHKGAKVEDIKEEFKDIVKDASPTLISRAEEELIREGMPREEIRKLCDVHIAVFKESLGKEKALAPSGHPVHTLMEEHKLMLKFAAELYSLSKKIEGASGFDEGSKEKEQLNHIIKHLKDSESHYLREENVLFPYLEKHGITQPPAIMWTEHDKIREIKKDVFGRVETYKTTAFKDFVKQLQEASLTLSEALSNHFYKENNILFPTALKVIEVHEWNDIRKQFDEIGYCCFTPESATLKPKEGTKLLQHEAEGTISFETGSFSREELESLLNNLPVDITFIGKDDTVRYFSQGKERIFVRTKAVIGRKVQQCHPQKSVHKVSQILEAFRNGSRDVAEFWINLKGRLVYIRYFPVRKENGEYLGCLEVTQDITEIKKIEGEKRLLDWS